MPARPVSQLQQAPSLTQHPYYLAIHWTAVPVRPLLMWACHPLQCPHVLPLLQSFHINLLSTSHLPGLDLPTLGLYPIEEAETQLPGMGCPVCTPACIPTCRTRFPCARSLLTPTTLACASVSRGLNPASPSPAVGICELKRQSTSPRVVFCGAGCKSQGSPSTLFSYLFPTIPGTDCPEFMPCSLDGSLDGW